MECRWERLCYRMAMKATDMSEFAIVLRLDMSDTAWGRERWDEARGRARAEGHVKRIYWMKCSPSCNGILDRGWERFFVRVASKRNEMVIIYNLKCTKSSTVAIKDVIVSYSVDMSSYSDPCYQSIQHNPTGGAAICIIINQLPYVKRTFSGRVNKCSVSFRRIHLVWGSSRITWQTHS